MDRYLILVLSILPFPAEYTGFTGILGTQRPDKAVRRSYGEISSDKMLGKPPNERICHPTLLHDGVVAEVSTDEWVGVLILPILWQPGVVGLLSPGNRCTNRSGMLSVVAGCIQRLTGPVRQFRVTLARPRPLRRRFRA